MTWISCDDYDNNPDDQEMVLVCDAYEHIGSIAKYNANEHEFEMLGFHPMPSDIGITHWRHYPKLPVIEEED